MRSEFRATQPSDAPALAALARRLLGVAPDGPMFSGRQMRWKYWSAPAPDVGPRGYVLVRDEAIVAHAGVLPLRFRAGSRALTLLHPFDWMSEPSAIGSGAALLQRLRKLADGLLIVGGSEPTRRMVRPLGFRPFGDVHLYAAPATASRGPCCSLSPLEPEALQGEPAQAGSPWLEVERHPAWLRACLTCPETPMALYAAHDGERPLGELLLAHAPGQLRIAAQWSRSGEPADRALMLHTARSQAAEHAGVGEIACMANTPRDRLALEAAGFHAHDAVPMFVLASRATVGDGEALSFQMIDGDLAFLHHGKPQPWLPSPSDVA
jgi:hypothetical protein